ncbi:FecR domain-containing protein [Candidatus Parcubacteria bacterium]|nr:FecR domain-containing protein [Candidatus Parcubacteria bacterium]
MKKKNIFVISLLLVLALALFFITTSKSKSDNPKTGENQNVLASDSKSSITVTPFSSDVSIKGIETDTFNIIQAPASTTVGSTVKTSKDGRALIESSFGHPIAVDFNSNVTIANSDSKNNETTIELISGGIWARTKKLVEKGEYLEIQTGNAVAVVRGTSFGLTYADNLTTLVVSEGEVSLSNKNKDTSEIVVKAGYKGTVYKNEKPILSRLNTSDKNSAWFKFNTNTYKAKSDNTIVSPKDSSVVSPQNIQNPSAAINPTALSSGSLGGGGSSMPSNSTNGVVIRSISPKTISSGDSKTFIVVTGSGLKNVVQVEVGEWPMSNLSVASDGSLQFTVDAQTGPGIYDIILNFSDESYFTIPNALTVTSGRAIN